MTNDIQTSLPATAGSRGYEEATSSYNLLHPARPEQAIIARSRDEVVRVVEYAADSDLPITVIATGHSLGSAQPLEGSLLVRVDFDETVVIDATRRVARVPAGATWGAVVAAASAHGLSALHGSSGTVSAIGYLLRGGISYYGRRFGVASNSVISITFVSADGATRTVSATEDPDVFWALRGGGGGFGIVTELELNLQPVRRVVTGITIWDSVDAPAIASRYLEWARTAPRSIATSLRVLNLPPLPGIPPVIAGRQVLAVDGAVTIDDETSAAAAERIAAELLTPLRALADPLLDSWATAGTEALLLTHMDPPDPLPYVGDHLLVRGLTSADMESLLHGIGHGSTSLLTAVELRQLGGAFAEPSANGGAFDSTTADFALVMVAAVGGPATVEHHTETMDRVRRLLGYRDTGYTVPTFVESATQPNRTFDDETERRVSAVRDRVDPFGRFRLMRTISVPGALPVRRP